MNTHTIDWLQLSSPDFVTKIDGIWEKVHSPIKFYKYCTQEKNTGIKILSGNPNTGEQLMILSGKSCNKLQKNIKQMIDDEIQAGGKVSRIDFCVTTESGVELELFDKALTQGKVVSRRFDTRKSKKVTDVNDTVETLYVGEMKKRGKKGIFRAYNKGLEQGLGIDLSRFELECKREVAHNNAKRYAIKNVEIGNIIRSAVDLPNEKWWLDIMGENKELPQLDKLEDTHKDDRVSRWHWLMSQVAPALGKAIAEDELFYDSIGNYEMFNDAVQRAYQQYIGMKKRQAPTDK